MNDTLILTILITVGFVVIVLPIGVFIFKSVDKKVVEKYKRNSRFNEIKNGMSENELYSKFGNPDKITEFDSTAKILTYYENKYKLLYTHTVKIQAQVKVKNGTVIEVTLSGEFWCNLF